MSGRRIVFMFSGQGSHGYHMGRELFEHDVSFRTCLRELDSAAHRLTGGSVLESLYDRSHSKAKPLTDIVLSSAAIFMVELSLARTLIRSGVEPDCVLGASMGAFAAAAVAGCLDPLVALEIAVTLAKTVEARCRPGGMTAVLADLAPLRERMLAMNGEIAAVTSPAQFVVSADEPSLQAIDAYLRRERVTFQRLPVKFAFHSRGVDTAEAAFRDFLQGVSLRRTTIPLVCCASGRRMTTIPQDYFWTMARQPIRFDWAIAALEEGGSCEYVDVGPGGSLATSLKYLLPSSSTSVARTLLSPFGGDVKNLASLVNIMIGPTSLQTSGVARL